VADLRRSGFGLRARSTSSPVFPMAPRKIWHGFGTAAVDLDLGWRLAET
jgi:hypothetical protein